MVLVAVCDNFPTAPKRGIPSHSLSSMNPTISPVAATLHCVKISLTLLTILLLASCTTEQPKQIGTALITPLSDLNLVNAPIPEPLLAASAAPYKIPIDQSCEALAVTVRALDEVLGPDLDTPPSSADPGLVERGTSAVGQAAVGAVQRTAESLVPFRSWVRKLSGAERYSKQVSAAIAAGTARRAFLRGIAAAKGCMKKS